MINSREMEWLILIKTSHFSTLYRKSLCVSLEELELSNTSAVQKCYVWIRFGKKNAHPL